MKGKRHRRMYVSKERGKGRSGRLEAEGVGLSRRG